MAGKKKKKSPAEVRQTLKWLEHQRKSRRSRHNFASQVHDEIVRQREAEEWEMRKKYRDAE